MFRKIILAVTLAGSSGAIASVQSPVSVIDYVSAGNFAQAAQAQDSFRALKDLNEIIYDRYIDRPWGDAYYPEADARWKKLRASVCPGLENFCVQKEELLTPQHWLSLVLNFKKPTVQEELRSLWANPAGDAPALYLNFGELPQQTDARNQFPVHNVVASGSESTATANYAGIGFFKRGIEVRETEYQYVSDLQSYKQGFGPDAGSVYFLVGAKGPILLADRVKRKAEDFALRWKFLVEQQADVPMDQIFQLDAFIARELSVRWKNVFTRKHTELRASLEASAAFEDDVAKKLPGSATVALARFDKEWLEFHWPEEVYQHVAYDFFRALNGELGLYHFAAGTERKGINFKRRAWESLLDLQSKFDAQAVLYFLSLESFFPSNVILDQLVDPATARGYFVEQLKAILEAGEFAGKPAFAKYGHLLLAPELRTEAFLTEEAPEALALIAGKDFAALAPEEKLAFYRALLWEGERVRPRALAVMIASLIHRGEPGLLKELALHVHSVRADEFKKP